jgi:hypothetical protein
MRGPSQEAQTQPLPARPVLRPPAFPRWLIIGSITGFVVVCSLLYGFDYAMLTTGHHESKAYDAVAGQWLARYAAALARFDELTASPQPTDPAWQTAIQQQFTTIKAVGTDIRAYHVSWLISWHSGMIRDVAGNYDEFVPLYTYGLEKDDHGAMYRGLQARQKADHYAGQFRTLVGAKPTNATPNASPGP